MAAATATTEALYLTQLFDEFNIDVSGVPLFVDNQGAIKTVGKSDISNRLKHIDVRYHLIKDHVAKKDVKIMYVESAENSADFLTKPLPREVFEKHICAIGMK
mmetsp:Transcript_27833/g.82546  ORF Transcript_27833/g.82546 Transcript_27833/m.82546 type:complete len:103 (-) Transcript_27833:718-1026(-)